MRIVFKTTIESFGKYHIFFLSKVALVIFARWKPSLAVVGALLFGMADAVQFRIQALGNENIPYEILLMLPYILTILVLFRGVKKTEQPEALGQPYMRGAR